MAKNFAVCAAYKNSYVDMAEANKLDNAIQNFRLAAIKRAKKDKIDIITLVGKTKFPIITNDKQMIGFIVFATLESSDKTVMIVTHKLKNVLMIYDMGGNLVQRNSI